MLFRNLNAHKLSFAIDHRRFEVEPGETCEIPDRISYVIELHGLPLTPVSAEPEPVAEKEEPAAAVPPPSPAQTRHWKKR